MKQKTASGYTTVLKKELKDAFRDKKSIFSTFILPLILFPLMFALMGLSTGDMVSQYEKPIVSIAYQGVFENKSITHEDGNATYDYFKNNVFADLPTGIEVKYRDSNDIKQDLMDEQIYLVIFVPTDFISKIDDPAETVTFILLVDERSTTSQTAYSIVTDLLKTFSHKIGADRAEAEGVNIDALQSDALTFEALFPDVVRYGSNNPMMLMMIPLLVTILLSVGGATIAIDLVAGEKERNTFEPLLSTSASRFNILTAKLTVVIIFSTISALMQVVAMMASIGFLGDSYGMGDISSLNLPFLGILFTALNLLMLAALFSCVLLLATATTRTVKEATARSSIFTFIPMIIAISTIALTVSSVSLGTAFIPIYNVIVSVKMLLAGVLNYTYIITSLAVNTLFAVLSIFITMKTFNKESLITKG